MTFKLSKKDEVNFMSLIIGTKSVIGADRPISQDIPVQICHHGDIDNIQPPALPNPEVTPRCCHTDGLCFPHWEEGGREGGKRRTSELAN